MASQQLPEELLELSTSKLPVKDLMRLKCISKSYNTRITTKSFFTEHFSQSIFAAKEKPNFLIFHFRDKFSMALVSEEYLEQSQNSKSPPPPIVDLEPQFPFPCHLLDNIIALGPSNGIFCLEVSVLHHPDRLILWNPATTKIKVLPLPLAVECSGWDYFTVLHGFGVDSKTNDYKVVNILVGQKLDNSENIQQPYAQVYSLRTNSWKKIAIDVPANNIVSSVHSSFLNGVYHWLTKSHNAEFESILCFDMSNDAFWKMNVPQVEAHIQGGANGREELVDTNVASINDLVAYVKGYRLSSPLRTRVEIWVMNEYGVEESWTKRFIIGPSPGRWIFWGFWKDDHREVLIAGADGEPLVLYNIDTQRRVKEFPDIIGIKYHAFRGKLYGVPPR